ncbi:hypothetical protein HN51_065510 [Arachis hypogaea]|nr:uncharacterized protein DS421_14g456640 [Arachis hypogaea]
MADLHHHQIDAFNKGLVGGVLKNIEDVDQKGHHHHHHNQYHHPRMPPSSFPIPMPGRNRQQQAPYNGYFGRQRVKGSFGNNQQQPHTTAATNTK